MIKENASVIMDYSLSSRSDSEQCSKIIIIELLAANENKGPCSLKLPSVDGKLTLLSYSIAN